MKIPQLWIKQKTTQTKDGVLVGSPGLEPGTSTL